ncbi:PSD1 domain-containing protein [Telmatocola sphagniphila]|uniref:PSD1 domain-containing protein n=1 Tax=Telmatocola sphagniphila TaxID=1123043 RepID=A0A8E6B633_9BACT|nr:PSD1 and planctomycete cytochrome C domain-containing protein [Telmatocola sphagniphila]QVL32159.1 PSD1 domain-containing protein [Telmatocola sphagniphila]
MTRFFFLFAALVFSVGSVRAEDAEFFEKKIRPILFDNCISCHGVQKQKADLRLDSKEALIKGGEGGPVLDVKNPEKSMLLDVISYKNDTKMPPKAKLKDEEIALLNQWVKMGSPWPAGAAASTTAKVEKFDLQKRAGHWSLQQIKSTPVPTVKAVQSPIDCFLLAKLEEKNLHYAPPADKATLLRRLSFDLTGLPPTIGELDAFLNDKSPNAYTRQVDRLLASPRFGERWARHWLDLARYAETMGHEFDFDMFEPWRYRDYVIRAFNEDLPYDQFVKEHLAGDLLPQPRINVKNNWNESILGTAFWHLYEAKHSPVDIRQDMADRFDNQLDVFSKTFLASTLSCAKCHDHKFDAITMRDYYSLMGVLESARYAKGFIDDPARVLPVLHQIDAVRKGQSDKLRNQIAAFKDLPKQPVEIRVPKDAGTNLVSELFQNRLPDENQRYSGEGPAFTLTPASGELIKLDKAWQILPPDAVAGGHLPKRFPGARRSKTFSIDSDYIFIRSQGNHITARLIVEHFQLIQEPIYGGLQYGIHSPAEPQWHTINTSMWKGRSAYLELIDSGNGEIVLDDIRFTDKPLQFDKVKVDLPETQKAWSKDPEHFRDAVAIEALNGWLRTSAELNKIEPDKGMDELAKKLPPIRQAMTLIEGSPQNEKVFIRGNYKKLGEEVPHRLFEVLHEPTFDQGSGRLELADRLCSAENPLIRRVIVNRVWQHLFGEGIVRTVDDFGVQGERPSHPELLDWLAEDFSQQGWSIKKLIRQIVTTEAYKQSSRMEAIVTADPQNRLLHHFPLKRLEAECVRDSMLQMAGRLNLTMEGPGVAPYLSDSMIGRGRPGASGPLDADGRRSIYLQVRRNFMNPMLAAFDYPTPFSTMGRRGVSNVPSQALILLNNPLVHQLSTAWAKRLLTETNPENRLQLLYRMAYARLPSLDELKIAKDFLSEAGTAQSELDSWTQLAHAVLNTKEFIFIP